MKIYNGMKAYCIVLILLVSAERINSQFSLGCPSGWEFYNNRCYKFEQDDQRIYDEANAACWMTGGSLLSIIDQQEHVFISNWLMKHDLQYGSTWFTSGVYYRENDTVVWGEDLTPGQVGWQLWVVGARPIPSNPFRRIAYVRGGPKFDGYGWEVVSPSVESAYICEMSKEEAQLMKITDRDFSYGQQTLDANQLQVGPKMAGQPRNIAVFGTPDSFFVECKIIGYPLPTFTWTREINSSQSFQVTSAWSNRYTLSAGRMSVQNPVSKTDAGTYQCGAENKYGKILSDPLKVEFGYLQYFSPVPPNQERANKYEGTRISCVAPAAYPDVTYSWFYNSIADPIFEEQENFFVSSSGFLYFSEVQPTDNRKYYCSVTLIAPYDYDTATDQPPSRISLGIDLVVAGEERGYFKPFIYTHTFPSRIQRGSRIRLECIAFGSLPLIYSWRREDGRPFEQGTEFSDRRRVLTIVNATLAAEGKYICTVNGRAGVAEKVIVLTIEAKPYFPFGIGNRFVDPDQTLQWRCRAVGRPEPTYVWYKNGVKIQNLPGSIEIKRGVLTIIKVSAQRDNGMYQCGATNVIGTTFSYGQLKVFSFAPNFDRYPMVSTLQIPLGGNYSIPCKVEGAPIPTVVWLKNGGVLPLTPGEVSGHVGMTFDNDLVFNFIDQSDQAVYTCKGTNVNGEASNSTQVTVVRGISIQTAPVDTRVRVNQTAFLFCQASYDSLSFDLTYQWKMNGYLIDMNNNPHFVQSQRNGMDGLYVRFAQFTHTGIYTCEAKTPIHMQSRSAWLYVDGPPGAPAGAYVEPSSVTSHSVQLIWSVHADINHGNPINKYDIEAEIDLYPDQWLIAASDVLESTSASNAINYGRRNDQRAVVVDGLLPDISYRFRVRAINDFGRGHEASTPSMSVKTPATAPVTVVQNIRGFPEGKVGTLNIVWDPLDVSEYSGDGVGYNVYFKKKDDPKEWFRAKVTGETKSMYTHEVGIDNYYLEYSVKIAAFNMYGEGPNSTIQTIMSAEGMPVVTVKMHDCNDYNASAFSMAWDPIEDSREVLKGKLKGYRIRYWHKLYPEIVIIRDIYGQADYTIIIGCEANTNYWATVQVMNNAGVGPVGEVRLGETWHHAPINWPRFVTVWPHGEHSVKVTWQGIAIHIAEEETIEGYILRIWKIQEDIRTAVDYKVDMEQVETIVDNLQTNTVYVLRMLGFGRGGDGAKSPHVYFTVGAGSVPFDPTTTRFCFSKEECSAGAKMTSSIFVFLLLQIYTFVL